MNSLFLDALKTRVLLFDGGMGTQVQDRELGPDDFGGKRWEGCLDYLSVTRPDVVESIHQAYFDAGADVVETNSFQASALRFAEWDLADRTHEINRAAASIARRVADRVAAADGRPRFVAGSIGPVRHAARRPRIRISDGSASRSSQAGFLRAGVGPDRGRRRRADPRDLPGHPRDEGADPRRARGDGAHRTAGADPVLGHARSDRSHAARHRHPRRARDARGDGVGRDRPQLLDRSRSHARCRALPVAEREHCRSTASRTPGSRSTTADARSTR